MSTATEEQRHRLATLVMQVADGTVTPHDALARVETWTDMPWSERLFEDVFHALKHYQIDEDIRAKDSSYATAQTEGLRRWSARLLAPMKQTG